MKETSFVLEAHDGESIACYRWSCDNGDTPKAIVQIAHGASEHAARYRRVAQTLVTAGYEVFANDHRAHGRTAADFGTFGVARPGGWHAIVEDVRTLNQHIQNELPDVPVVLFGHSMGSMIAQQYLQAWGDGLSALVLSGTTGGRGLDQETLDMIVAVGAGDDADQPSEIFAARFAAFNEPFASDEATGFEWLSRDVGEVQLYVEDPWCGEPLSNGYVADMLSATSTMWRPESEQTIRRDLPIYVMGGDNDPVGGENVSTVRELVARYRELGAGPITLKLYENGRHEMLNELNRDEVEADLVAWIDSTLA